MSVRKVFKMPKPVGITGRTSTITNSFVNSIIPVIVPSDDELEESLRILKLNKDDLRCAYCGGHATEWDHLRPIVAAKRPTGYISEIHNLVPSCGKCNQSKGGKYWKDWIRSNAKLSPKTRRVTGLDEKIACLVVYEKWGNVKPHDFEKLVGSEHWKRHWRNCEELHNKMKEAQKLADQIRKTIRGQSVGKKLKK